MDSEQKSLVVQSRHAYAFSRAFMVTGDERYLDLADHALAFLYQHGWDDTYGGWFFSVDRDGDLLAFNEWWDPNTFKWVFTQHYALLGIGARYEAGPNDRELEWFERGVASNETFLWDPESGGYFEEADPDWANPRGKGFTGTIDGITTHALLALLTLDEPHYEERFFALADIAATTLVGSMDHPAVELGFAERYTPEWRVNTEQSGGSVGHQLKVVWSLSRAYMLDPQPRYRDGAERLFRDVLANDMYDTERGAPWMDYDFITGEVVREEKDYWMTQQAIMAGITLAQITRSRELRNQALAMASQSLDFYMANFVDPDHGEIFSQVAGDGTVSNPVKGDFFKGSYHSVETAYLTYLYSSAFITREPFTLYYRFGAASGARSVTLNPIAFPSLRITAARSDQGRLEFDPGDRTVHLPRNFAGVVAVTFAPPFEHR